MLPSQTQRVLMLVAVVIGTPAWWWAAGLMLPGDGLSGWALSDPGGPGLWIASGLIVVTALPAVIAAGFIAAAGNPLSAVLCVAISGVIAHHGNAMAGVARRAADAGNASGLYPRLAFELLAGVVVVTVLLALVQAAADGWRSRVPRRMRSRHLGESVHLWKVDARSVTAGLVTAAVGGVLTAGLVRSGDPQQVVGGLFLAFVIASLIGQAVAPNHRPWPTLIAPAEVGIVGYLWAARRVSAAGDADALLTAWYEQTLPGLALGLPLHYLTAGVAGCAVGIGIGQLVEHAKLGEG